jgi:predicted metal-binding membrane protein
MNGNSSASLRASLSFPVASPLLFTGLMAVILITWIATARLMGGMDAGPGTPLGGVGWFVGSWVIMMTAMMLPAELRFAMVFAQLSREETATLSSASKQMGAFLGGYLVVWTAYGMAAYGIDWMLRAHLSHILAWDAYGPVLAGIAIAVAGVYQLSPLKQVCLQHCVSPLRFFMQRWQAGMGGALRMGMAHGLLCVGCCWGLMLILFALGIMSLWWMSLLTLAMFAEKMPLWGPRLARPLGIGLLVLGLWVAAEPSTVPFLTMPTAQHRHHP